MDKAAGPGPIIIADEIDSIAADIATILADRSLTDTVIVGTLNAAMATVAARRPSLVICECKFGRRWATPLLDVLKNEGIPVILTSAMTEDEIPRELRIHPVLYKPVEDRLLLRAVTDVLGHARL